MDKRTALLAIIPFIIVGGVWLSPLSFVPVPWPDDSAFYFVAKDLFQWPPKWVMTSQAPFEPTYRIFNFNTMPLFPILIGLGRLIGLDGSFLLKLWPLGAWALSGCISAVTLYKKGLPWFITLLVVLGISLDPALRWASVLIRPESLIGLIGTLLVLILTFRIPDRFQPSRYWDPIAALLALGAYSHFNSIHLIVPVVFGLIQDPKRIFSIGWKTAFYLTPWFICVVIWRKIFILQMVLQWSRLNIPNPWLTSVGEALRGIFQSLGSPEPWPPILLWVAGAMWIIIISVFIIEILTRASPFLNNQSDLSKISLLPAVGWMISSIWLFQSKPEVWFIYYFHIAFWILAGVFCLKQWRSSSLLSKFSGPILTVTLVLIVGVFGWVDITQSIRLGQTQSWNWKTYNQLIECVDKQLVQYQSELRVNQKFRVWCPTFPDITIELSRKHPDWEFTRTNDFWSRKELAIRHGWEANAVVVTETLGELEREVSDLPEHVPEIQSAWMNWRPYFLFELGNSYHWKPNRFICQRGRWQAFIFMEKSLLR